MSIHFVNFEPSAEEKASLEKHLDSLQAHIPSESYGVAQFRKEKNGFYGFMEIHSSQGEFACTERHASFSELVTHLHKRLQTQIQAWQQHRFEAHQSHIGYRWYTTQDIPYFHMFNNTPQKNCV